MWNYYSVSVDSDAHMIENIICMVISGVDGDFHISLPFVPPLGYVMSVGDKRYVIYKGIIEIGLTVRPNGITNHSVTVFLEPV